ncbi:MAG: putative carbon monoxide dehydrogenase accessory protein [Acidimicrobiales bacterium]|nr:putative carbon monoxide dehydrogenase accessory protein [Acidimicrobiales bacterium]
MELVNEFTVNRPIDEAWAVLTDVERIAPCLPGAQLQEIEGDIYRGVVKVKVGPITAALKGEASFVERDDENHRAVLKGDGRDIKGNGNASALITATLEEISPTSAKCVVHTDLNMTGKVAQFGRGALADISGKLMAQFATNLDAMLAKDAAGAPEAAAEPTTETDADAEPATDADAAPAVAETSADADAATPATEAAADPAKPTTRIINGPAAEPIDAFSLGGSALLKRLLPVFGGVVILLLALSRARKK